jgi:hypothetical protein
MIPRDQTRGFRLPRSRISRLPGAEETSDRESMQA